MQRVGDEYTVVDANGNGINAATVLVYDAVTLLPLANVYNSGGSLVSPASKSNPFTTDAIGRWSIALPDGRYNFEISGGNITTYTVSNVAVFDSTVTYPSPALGTVTQVAATVPVELAVAGSPIIGTGTLAFTWASGTGAGGAGKFIGTPSGGGAGLYVGRVMVLADLPAHGPGAATYGSATQVPQLVVNAQGIATGISNLTITPAFSSLTAKPTTMSGFGITDGIIVMYRTATSKTVGNTTTETTLFSAGSGTLTLPANQLLAHTTVRVKITGFMTATIAAQTLRLRFKFAGVPVLDTTALTFATTSSVASSPFTLEVVFMCLTTGVGGTGQGQIILLTPGLAIGTNSNTYIWPQPGFTATSSMDTTVGNLLDLTAQWGAAAAASTITVTRAQVFVEG